MNQFAKSFLAAGIIAATLSGSAVCAATLERDIYADNYIIKRDEGQTGSFGIKMTDADGKTVHLSFSQDALYRFQLAADVASGKQYILTIGNQGETEAEQIQNIGVYAAADKLAVLAALNAAESEAAVKTILKEKADVLELNRHPIYYTDEATLTDLTDAELSIIAKAIYAQGVDYADLQAFYAAYYASKGLILLNSAKNAPVAVHIGHLYESYLHFDALEGYALVSNFMDDLYPYYIGQNKTTHESAAAAFGSYAFLCALGHTENEQQVLDMFEQYSNLVTFDLKTWNESVKSQTAKALVGKSFQTMNELEAAILKAAGTSDTTDSGNNRGNGGRGGGRGGSSVAIAPGKLSDMDKPRALYRDLDASHWAFETVKYLTESRVVCGDESGNFNPNAAVTRAEFAKMLTSGFGLYDASANSSFTDLPQEHWAYVYVSSLAEKGIISGMDSETFGTISPISRQDMAVMIARISGVFSGGEELNFADSAEISEYAKAAVTALSSLNIMKGYEDGTFCPHKSVTRAEAAAVAARSMKLFMGGSVE